jgi:hypothetical protein
MNVTATSKHIVTAEQGPWTEHPDAVWLRLRIAAVRPRGHSIVAVLGTVPARLLAQAILDNCDEIDALNGTPTT